FRFRGVLFMFDEAYVEAANDFERAIALGDHSSANYLDAGDALNAGGEFDRAETMFSAALERTPGHPDALFGRARARFKLSRFQDAVGDLDDLLEKVPDHAHAGRLRALANAGLGQANATQADMNADSGGFLHPAQPELWDYYLAQARQHLAAGELDEAHTAAK